MQLYTIDTGYLKLDGGAMFGIVPKSIWQSLNPPDERNLCTWAMRCLLIEDGNRLALIDTGVGNKMNEKLRSHFEPHGDDTLIKSLKKHGFSPEDITDVILTHLHFDHCGGAVDKTGDGKLALAFPNAHYWSSEKHWEWAMKPNPRERASFLKENLLPLSESGHLKFIEQEAIGIQGLETKFVFGHTEAMMVCHISGYKDKKISYAADLIPSRHHVRMPYVMAYDVRPINTLAEKAALLEEAVTDGNILMFEHDLEIECCNLKRTDLGIMVNNTFALSEL